MHAVWTAEGMGAERNFAACISRRAHKSDPARHRQLIKYRIAVGLTRSASWMDYGQKKLSY